MNFECKIKIKNKNIKQNNNTMGVIKKNYTVYMEKSIKFIKCVVFFVHLDHV